MDYVFGRIDDAVDSIETYSKKVLERPVETFEASDLYKKEHPEIPCFESPDKLKSEVLRYLSRAVQCLRAAAVYAKCAEWLEDAWYGNAVTKQQVINILNKLLITTSQTAFM